MITPAGLSHLARALPTEVKVCLMASDGPLSEVHLVKVTTHTGASGVSLSLEMSFVATRTGVGDLVLTLLGENNPLVRVPFEQLVHTGETVFVAF